jgi:hypothetical protein
MNVCAKMFLYFLEAFLSRPKIRHVVYLPLSEVIVHGISFLALDVAATAPRLYEPQNIDV